MPGRPFKPCGHAGCRALVNDGTNRCQAHKPKAWARSADAPERLRGRRGVARRRYFLQRHPLCVLCMQTGRITAAEEIDHVVPLARGGADDESNLRPLCRACHARVTAEMRGHRAKGADADGVPTDPNHPWNK